MHLLAVVAAGFLRHRWFLSVLSFPYFHQTSCVPAQKVLLKVLSRIHPCLGKYCLFIRQPKKKKHKCQIRALTNDCRQKQNDSYQLISPKVPHNERTQLYKVRKSCSERPEDCLTPERQQGQGSTHLTLYEHINPCDCLLNI